MIKEIMEQPDVVAACLESRVAEDHVPAIFGPRADALFSKVKHVQLVACGTSYHAALVMRYWLETLAHIPCSVEVASEFRYRRLRLHPTVCLSRFPNQVKQQIRWLLCVSRRKCLILLPSRL